MPERTSYAQGTPSWVDLPTSDQNAAKTFYAGVFGWTYDDQPMGEGAVYSLAKVRGLDVAAISPQPPEMAAAGAPPMWNTYITVDSADDAAAKIGAAGGKVLMEPFDVMDAGRMVFAMDPGGAMVAFWQPNQHIGAQLVNEPGAITWNELITTDPSSAKFYEQVAGMTTSTMDMGQGEYTLFNAGDQMVGGTVPPQMAGVPNHWHVYFAVDDADATATKVTELGGTILVPPFDTPVGRIAVAQDPQGAVFSFMKPAPPARLTEPVVEIPKPSEADKEFFRSMLPDDPEVEVKPMFGNLGAFVHGNMFAGLFGPAVGVRLDDAARAELEGIDGTGPFGPAERPMGGYTSLPAAWRATPEVAAGWAERALTHVSALPPKVKKPKAARK